VLDKQQEQFTYRLGANYLLDNGLSPYLSYATSFEPVLGGDIDGKAFDPTTGEQIEAGIKYDGSNLTENLNLFTSIAVFKITQDDVVATGFNPSLPVFGVQLGQVEISGLELEFVARINDALSINGAASFTDSEITESNVALEVGEPLPVTPKRKVSLLVDYTFQGGILQGFGFNIGARYTSESAGSLPGAYNPVVYNSDDSFLVDASLRYDTTKWRFSINASNLADEKYIARCASVSNCNFGAGRQVIGTAMLKF
jgi:iron complex outermembrane receptor protein